VEGELDGEIMKTSLLLFSVLLGAVNCLGQATEPPPPAATGVQVADTNPLPRYEDNVRPLSGVQNFDVGTRTEYMNVLIPAFTFSGSYGTNPGLQSGTQGETVWGYTTNLGGSLDMMRGSAAKLFSMSYRGSAQLNSYNSSLNTQIHSLDMTESITTGRWTYVLGDTLSYQPNAYGAYAPLLFPGIGTGIPGGGLQNGVTPNDTVLTSQNTQLSNTSIGQVTYGLSRASSVTGSVSYGILHYLEGDLLDNRQLNATGGFDHRFGRNTMGVSYTHSRFMYDNIDQNFYTNTIHLTYGRRVIGRFSLSLEAGPTLRTLTTGSNSSTSTDVSGSASFQYTSNRTNFSLGYARAVTGGSGVLIGAITDTVSFSADRRLSHTLSANAAAGYSKNSEINTGNTVTGTDYKTFFVGAGISQQIGRYLSFGLGYRGQRQTSDLAIANLTSHSAVVTMQWRFRPLRLK
jgi:hypothetical protein